MVSDRQAALRILGLTDGASDDEIRDAYKRMSMKWWVKVWSPAEITVVPLALCTHSMHAASMHAASSSGWHFEVAT
jgi:hypothetical protein